MRDTEREREAETQAEGEAGSMHREPDAVLDPGTPGSCPGPKAGTKLLSHPGIPKIYILITRFRAPVNDFIHVLFQPKFLEPGWS